MKKVLKAVILSVMVLSLSLLAAGQASSSSLNEQLITAAKSGDTAAVQQLLQQGANVNAKDNNGMTALLEAAYTGNVDIARLLVEKGANLDAYNRDGLTALLFAGRQGHIGVVKLLLENGANTNVKDDNGYTALMFAAVNGDVGVLNLLIDKGAALEAKNTNGNTALMMSATAAHHIEVVRALIKAGANVNTKDAQGYSVLWVTQNIIPEDAAEASRRKEFSDSLKQAGAR